MSTKKIQIIGNSATKDDIENIHSDINALEVVVDGKANQATTLDGYGITVRIHAPTVKNLRNVLIIMPMLSQY